MHNETGGSDHRSPHMQHDAIHKLLCSFPRVIADILRGYLGGNLVGRLDFHTLQQVSAERVTQALKRRLNDSVWRVRCDDGTWVWVYLVLEFQSSPDPRMALRMLGYVAALYEELERLEEFRGGKVPAVLAVVLYNGDREWVGALDTRERIALAPGSDVEEMLPRMRFPVIDERRAGRRAAELGNVAGLMFQLWNLSSLEELAELVGRLRRWLGGAGERSLREAFETVLEEQVIPAYFEEGSEMRGARGLSIIENMLRGNVVPFAVQYERRGQRKGLEKGREEGLEKGLEKGREEGLEKGREEGLEKGREEIRGMHVRMARARFGGRVSERLTALLRPVRSLGLLGQIGDVVVAAETGEELLARVADLALAEPADGGFRA